MVKTLRLLFAAKEKTSPRKKNVERVLHRVRSMTENDRTRPDVNSGDRRRSRSFTESDRSLADTGRLKKTATVSTSAEKIADKKVIVVGELNHRVINSVL